MPKRPYLKRTTCQIINKTIQNILLGHLSKYFESFAIISAYFPHYSWVSHFLKIVAEESKYSQKIQNKSGVKKTIV
jgi:hypothetical protein